MNSDFYNNNFSLGSVKLLKIIYQKGGEFGYNNYTNLLLGLSFITIAIAILLGERNWKNKKANINNINCSSSNCLLNINYETDDGKIYNKDLSVSKDYKNESRKVDILYNLENPEICHLKNENLINYIYILLGSGMLFLIIWFFSLETAKCD
jgi:hypothetical protein